MKLFVSGSALALVMAGLSAVVAAPQGVPPPPKEAICHGQRGFIVFPANNTEEVSFKIGTPINAVYCAVNGYDYPPRRVTAFMSNGVDGLGDGGVLLSPVSGLPASTDPNVSLAKYLGYPVTFTVPPAFLVGRKQIMFIEEYKDANNGSLTPFVYRSRKFTVL